MLNKYKLTLYRHGTTIMVTQHIYSVLYMVESMLAQRAAALSGLVLIPTGDDGVTGDVIGSLSSASK